ncbi:MAG: toll/interleukin-1 receptor domain-containing protein [Pseudomonadota bacterium]
MKATAHPRPYQPNDRDVFVSYTTRDKEVEAASELAEQLNTALKREGLGATVRRRIWWDKDQIGSFEGSSGRLAQILRAGIVEARCLVSIQTATYRNAPWCHFECDTARAFGVKIIDVRPDDLELAARLKQVIESIRDAIHKSGAPDTLGFRGDASASLIPISSDEALVACALGATHGTEPEVRDYWKTGLEQAQVRGWRRPRIEFQDFAPSHFGYHLLSGATLIDLREAERIAHRNDTHDFDGVYWTDRFFGRTTRANIRALLPLDIGPLKKMRPHMEDMI